METLVEVVEILLVLVLELLSQSLRLLDTFHKLLVFLVLFLDLLVEAGVLPLLASLLPFLVQLKALFV